MRSVLAVLLTLLCVVGASAQPLDPIEPGDSFTFAQNPYRPILDFGDDNGAWPNDGECDDPRFGGVAAAAEPTSDGLLRDATDCRAAYESGLIILNPVDFGGVDSQDVTRCSAALDGSINLPMASCLLDYWQTPETGVITAWTDTCPAASQPGSTSVNWEQLMTCRATQGSMPYPDVLPIPDGARVRDYAWLPPMQPWSNLDYAGLGSEWSGPVRGPFVWPQIDAETIYSHSNFQEQGPAFSLTPEVMRSFGVTTPGRGVEIFFATDRQPKPTGQMLTFAGQRADEITMGTMVVSVPLRHTRGRTERPWWLFPENPSEHFVITALQKQSEGDFLASLAKRQEAGATYKNQAFIYVHGFANTFEDAAYRAAQMTYDMGFDGVPIIYSWPSKGALSEYVSDLPTSEASARHLASFMRFLLNRSGLEQIHLICHSMGCNAAIRALEQMEDSEAGDTYAVDSTGAPIALGEVLFAAPDIDVDVFEGFADDLVAMKLPMTLYASGSDKALWAAGDLLARYPRAGFIPDGQQPALIEGLETIDITALGMNWLEPEHSDFADEAIIMNDIGLLLSAGTRPPPRRTTGYKTMQDDQGRTYWLY